MEFLGRNSTQKVQRVMLYMPVGNSPMYNTLEVSKLAGVKEGIAKKTLRTSKCIVTKRSGGPKKTRSEESDHTLFKSFDAVIEPNDQGLIPDKCRECKFANSGFMTTLIRNRKTVSGCEILKQRKREMEVSE